MRQKLNISADQQVDVKDGNWTKLDFINPANRKKLLDYWLSDDIDPTSPAQEARYYQKLATMKKHESFTPMERLQITKRKLWQMNKIRTIGYDPLYVTERGKNELRYRQERIRINNHKESKSDWDDDAMREFESSLNNMFPRTKEFKEHVAKIVEDSGFVFSSSNIVDDVESKLGRHDSFLTFQSSLPTVTIPDQSTFDWNTVGDSQIICCDSCGQLLCSNTPNLQCHKQFCHSCVYKSSDFNTLNPQFVAEQGCDTSKSTISSTTVEFPTPAENEVEMKSESQLSNPVPV